MLVYDDANMVLSRSVCCFKCRTVVASLDDLVSTTYTCGKGRAFLFSHAWNVTEGPRVDRRMITGTHLAANVFCCNCKEILGWTYVKAYDRENMHKEGKTVLIKLKIITELEP